MITRAQMPRQLRNRGGMTVKTVRQKYGLGSLVKKTIRKLIPNELADVAVKAAPFVAPFNPGAAALMRGVGRFDQRGSISDALKQGAATFAFGKGVGKLGGAQTGEGFFGGQKFSMEGFREGPIGSIFPKTTTTDVNTLPKTKPVVSDKETGIVRAITDKTIAKIPGAKKLLPKSVMDQLVVGGITSGASALYSYFSGDFRPQEEGETMEEYLAARKESVGKQMRTFMDNYYRFDPEYSAMSDAERDAFVARYNMNQGGIARLGYQTGDLVDPRMRRSLAENVREQKAAREMNRKTRLERFADHARVSQAMKGKTGMGVIPQYALQTGADFQKKFPEINPKVSAVLASGYQLAQEGARALNPLTPDKFLRFPTALKTAQEQATKNIEGILAADTGTLTAKQMEDRNRYLASQGQPTEPVPTEYGSVDDLMEFTGESFANVPISVLNLLGTIPASDYARQGPRTQEVAKIILEKTGKPYQYFLGLKKGGIIDVPVRTNSEGVKELDYRKTGGFVPIGVKEKADDVPAMLSKNEFVFTADAVRGAGDGSIKKGAQRMYDTMKKLESRVG